MSNFPPGAASDPNAPYNEVDLDPLDWEGSGERDECHHCGRFGEVDDNNICEHCYNDNVELQIFAKED